MGNTLGKVWHWDTLERGREQANHSQMVGELEGGHRQGEVQFSRKRAFIDNPFFFQVSFFNVSILFSNSKQINMSYHDKGHIAYINSAFLE